MPCNRHPRHADSPLKHLARNPFGALPPELAERLGRWSDNPAIDGPFRGSGGEWQAWIPERGDPASGEQLTGYDPDDPGKSAEQLLDKLEDRFGEPPPPG
jgi:hypothetical protein